MVIHIILICFEPATTHLLIVLYICENWELVAQTVQKLCLTKAFHNMASWRPCFLWIKLKWIHLLMVLLIL
jgi:hypothetical protein